jgi:hypothetical protein
MTGGVCLVVGMDALPFEVWYDIACLVPTTCDTACLASWLYANACTHDAITPAINYTLPRIKRKARLSQQRLAMTTLGMKNTRLVITVGKGDLATCKWICLNHCFNSLDSAEMLTLAASSGNLEACRWVAEFFQLSTNDVRAFCMYWSDCPRALTFAAQAGHLELCKWMVEERFWFSFEELKSVVHHLESIYVQSVKSIRVHNWLLDHTKSRKQYALNTLQRWAAL